MANSTFYSCRVMHRRPGPPRYRFTYRSFYLLLDIDAIDAACAATPLLARNRFNLLSFHDADHGAHDGSDLRAWVEGVLRERGIELAGGRIRLLTMPRVLGYGFNPISVFYCEHAGGELRAIVVEVHNTFGEHHCYVLHGDGAAVAWGANYSKTKQFHVSPFLRRQGAYRFRFTAPGERLAIGIRLYDDGADTADTANTAGLRIATALTGRCIEISTTNVLKLCGRMPLMPFKVVAAIYWQALKIWLRGGRFHRKPEASRPNVS